MFKTTSKLRIFKNFTVCVSSFHESLFVRNSEPKLGHLDKLFPLSYTILLEDLLGINKWSQKHGGSYAIAMTTGP
jgi:tRNA A37 threonylcarbamoyladenosine synthetase subunit TsaC/SUA5/YrdC